MQRVKFDSQGRLAGFVSNDGKKSTGLKGTFTKEGYRDEFDAIDERIEDKLLKSSELSFLKEQEKIDGFIDQGYWSLYSGNEKLNPMTFSNGKTQEDVVKEVVDHIKAGKKIIFIHGACGTGKSAVALNIARKLGRACIVVPVKGLQKQYEADYTRTKYVIKEDGRKMNIAMITGRDNHDSIFFEGKSCADPLLPDTIKITEKNFNLIKEYYDQNHLIQSKGQFIDLKKLKRISIAPVNPYWSPIVDAEYEFPLRDARKKKYRGLNGRDFIFYHRKEGCSYYDQYLSYLTADVIIFNSAKYKIEVALDRKPETAVDIIDEADEFLDSFSTQEEINLTRLSNALSALQPFNDEAIEAKRGLIESIGFEEQNKRAVGIDEKKVYLLKETQAYKILELINESEELKSEILSDELNYANKAIEVAEIFHGMEPDTYVLFSKRDNDLYCSFVTTNLAKKFEEMSGKLSSLVLMSGTLHSKEVLSKIFGINDFAYVEAETKMPGTLEIHRTGREINCKFGTYQREDYLRALSSCLKSGNKPMLVHVNSFEDLPNEGEKVNYELGNVMSKETLLALQMDDKNGRMIADFKAKLSDVLYSTKCSRGVDFPGDICNSIIFTKYPYPNVQGIFWKILEKTHKDAYWDFYKDKAKREFLQRIYRGLRSEKDHVYILSPDIRVLDAARKVQEGKF